MNNEHNRFGSRRGRFLFILFGPLFLLLLGVVVRSLWNAILPELVAVNRISYWQAVGLLILCRILFGGFRGFGGRTGKFEGANGWWAGRSKWQHMTDEERQNFREQWRKRCEERKKWKEQQ